MAPTHELARLDALVRSRILDSPPEREFDDLVRVAASALDCPFALLSFVDSERSWIKAELGIGCTSFPRATSFCDHAIACERPLVVEDTLRDPRFMDHPLVQATPRVRFYSAAPVLDESHAIGTLAVLDTKPRTLSPNQGELLTALARTASALLERRRLRDERLLKSEALLLSATRIANIGCWQWNMETGEITWTRELFQIFGLPHDFKPSLEAYGERLHPDDRAVVGQRTELALAGQMTTFPDYRIVRPDGQVRTVQATAELERDSRGKAVLLTGALIDVTDRRRADDEAKQLTMQRMHSQKLESLGVLSAGVAHDFNNLLVGVLGNAELAAADETLRPETRELIERVSEAATQAAGLTRQLLAYTGRGHMETAEVDLSSYVAPITDLLRASISKSITLTTALPEQLPAIRADVDQLQQITMNLILNAAESYGSASGEVRVRTFATIVNQEESHDLVAPTALTPGPYVVFEVVDGGVGMSRATLDRVFEPFFTTKFTGRGLGLAAVLGIARSHGAVLTVDSVVGQGSRFRVHFPALDRIAQKRKREPSRARPTPTLLRGRTALVVDDEARVRSLERRVLSDAGMRVLEAEHGAEAIALLAQNRSAVDAVVLDLVMPGLDSASTLSELRRLRPDLPVIVQSGYPEEEAIARLQKVDGRLAFLQKPFSPKTLVAKLCQLLESSPAREE